MHNLLKHLEERINHNDREAQTSAQSGHSQIAATHRGQAEAYKDILERVRNSDEVKQAEKAKAEQAAPKADKPADKPADAPADKPKAKAPKAKAPKAKATKAKAVDAAQDAKAKLDEAAERAKAANTPPSDARQNEVKTTSSPQPSAPGTPATQPARDRS